MIRLVMEGHLRGIIGQLTVEQIVKEPEMVARADARDLHADDMSKMGLEVISFTIKRGSRQERVHHQHGTAGCGADQAAMRRSPSAEAERDTAIRRAIALREAATAKAAADQERVIAETASRWASRRRRSAIFRHPEGAVYRAEPAAGSAGGQGL